MSVQLSDYVRFRAGYPPEACPVIASRVGSALREMARAEKPLIGKEGFRDTAVWRLR